MEKWYEIERVTGWKYATAYTVDGHLLLSVVCVACWRIRPQLSTINFYATDKIFTETLRKVREVYCKTLENVKTGWIREEHRPENNLIDWSKESERDTKKD